MKKHQKILSFLNKHSVMLAILGVLAVFSGGFYIASQSTFKTISHAGTVAGGTVYIDECGRYHDPSSFYSDCDVSKKYNSGDVMTIPIYANLNYQYTWLNGLPSYQHVYIKISGFYSVVSYNAGSFVCAHSGDCLNPSGGYVGNNNTTGQPDVVKCINIRASNVGNIKVKLATVTYTKTSSNMSGYDPGYYKIEVRPDWQRGKCGSNENAPCQLSTSVYCITAFTLASHGNFIGEGDGDNPPGGPITPDGDGDNPPGGPITPDGDGGNPPGGPITPDSGDGAPSSKPSKTKTTKPSNSSERKAPANSATTQGDQKNSVPAPSSQGETKKKKAITPSPFFDGRQYLPGSLSDTAATIPLGNSSILVNWFMILAGVSTGVLVSGVVTTVLIIRARRK